MKWEIKEPEVNGSGEKMDWECWQMWNILKFLYIDFYSVWGGGGE